MKRSSFVADNPAVEAAAAKLTKTGCRGGSFVGGAHRLHYLNLDAFARHKQFVNNYLRFYGSLDDFKRDTSRDKRDIDVIRENHRFLWDEEDIDNTWEKRLAKKYYDKLFREYCICDLSRYKENKIAMRWRVEQEVVDGKGQFSCGAKQCKEKEGLRSWELNFAYEEHKERKNALVKLRLCAECSRRLNYRHRRKEAKPEVKKERVDVADAGDPEQKRPEATVVKQEPTEGKEPEAEKTEEETNVWSAPLKITDEKSRSEEFDDYFEDMFL